MARKPSDGRQRKGNQGGDGPIEGLGGLLGGLGNLLEKLGALAEKGEELRESGAIGNDAVRGVYGFTFKSGLGGERGNVKIEPFGNVRKDEETGRASVHEDIEPLVDVFEEDDHVLVVVEMPGVGEDDLSLELHDDVLTIAASRGPKKYRKEVLLPAAFAADAMNWTCRNGILEIKLAKAGGTNA
jgi:HSP20 family protein